MSISVCAGLSSPSGNKNQKKISDMKSLFKSMGWNIKNLDLDSTKLKLINKRKPFQDFNFADKSVLGYLVIRLLII